MNTVLGNIIRANVANIEGLANIDGYKDQDTLVIRSLNLSSKDWLLLKDIIEYWETRLDALR